MKKIIPIIAFCCSMLIFSLSLTGLITVSIATKVEQVTFVAVPTVIFGSVLSMLSVGFVYILRNDKLCRIAFFIDVAAFCISIVSVFIWLCLL
ncbi:MAG: hypothetical protein J1G01_06545 [Clostridiales bacterium]|nr:hypothetical protein [Clostridiales bacterium]